MVENRKNTQDWRPRGACRTEGAELFFPVETISGPALLQIAEAKTVCATCPVKDQCGEEALRHNYLGVWGGMSEDERRALKRRGGHSI